MGGPFPPRCPSRSGWPRPPRTVTWRPEFSGRRGGQMLPLDRSGDSLGTALRATGQVTRPTGLRAPLPGEMLYPTGAASLTVSIKGLLSISTKKRSYLKHRMKVLCGVMATMYIFTFKHAAWPETKSPSEMGTERVRPARGSSPVLALQPQTSGKNTQPPKPASSAAAPKTTRREPRNSPQRAETPRKG